MAKKNRNLKVVGQSGYKYQETPIIMLKGMWLRECGFDIGDYVSIICEEGKLTISSDAERKEMEKAIADKEQMMEKELKKQQKEIRALFVAERDERYGK